MLKEKLLSTNLFIDNEYLDKYVNLILEGIEIGYIKYKTHKHHIIPRAYYQYNNIEVDNSNNNLVFLLFKNHLLAHYYMARCAKTEEFRYINELAFYYLNNKKYFSVEEIELVKKLPEYQNLYEEMCRIRANKNKGRKFTDEQKLRCSNAQKLRYSLHPITDEVRKHMSEAQKNKSYRPSEETKQKHRDAILGRKRMVNLDTHVEKLVPQEKIEEYLDSGWIFGTFHSGYKDSDETKLKKSISMKGKQKSESHLQAIKQSNSNRRYVTDGNITKRVKEQDVQHYLDLGWKLGNNFDYSYLSSATERNSKISKQNKGRIWINNGVVSKMVKKEQLDEFLINGFVKGRIK